MPSLFYPLAVNDKVKKWRGTQLSYSNSILQDAFISEPDGSPSGG